MSDIDFNASASAEANVIKFDNPKLEIAPSVTLNVSTSKSNSDRRSKEPFVHRFLSGARKAINPAGYAKEQAEALDIRADAEARAMMSHEEAIAEACRICLESQPWMTARQAYLHVMGHPVTQAEAENVFEVFEKAQSMLSDSAAIEEPTEEIKDASVKGAASAYDDEVRELWAKLVAGELERSGSFPKSTYEVLRRMDARIIGLFKKLCSTCVESAEGFPSLDISPIPFLEYDEGSTSLLNNNLLSVSELFELETSGVFFTNLYRDYSIRDHLFIGINGKPYKILNEGDEKKLSFKNGQLSDAGRRLSNLCERGNSPQLPNIVARRVKESGMMFFELISKNGRSPFEVREL